MATDEIPSHQGDYQRCSSMKCSRKVSAGTGYVQAHQMAPAEAQDLNLLRSRLQRDGYLLLRNFLDAFEVIQVIGRA